MYLFLMNAAKSFIENLIILLLLTSILFTLCISFDDKILPVL